MPRLRADEVLRCTVRFPRSPAAFEDWVGGYHRPKVSLAYTADTRWRNRAEFLSGRDQAQVFLERKWATELDYRLITKLRAFSDNRIAVRYA